MGDPFDLAAGWLEENLLIPMLYQFGALAFVIGLAGAISVGDPTSVVVLGPVLLLLVRVLGYGRQLQNAIQSGVDSDQPGRKHFEESVVTIADTPEGRLVGEHYVADGKRWMIIAPGSSSSIATAVNKMMRRLPASQEWHSYRKVV